MGVCPFGSRDREPGHPVHTGLARLQRGFGAAGSAFAWHAKGRGFDSRKLHGGGCRFESGPACRVRSASGDVRVAESPSQPGRRGPVAQMDRVPHLGMTAKVAGTPRKRCRSRFDSGHFHARSSGCSSAWQSARFGAERASVQIGLSRLGEGTPGLGSGEGSPSGPPSPVQRAVGQWQTAGLGDRKRLVRFQPARLLAGPFRMRPFSEVRGSTPCLAD